MKWHKIRDAFPCIQGIHVTKKQDIYTSSHRQSFPEGEDEVGGIPTTGGFCDGRYHSLWHHGSRAAGGLAQGRDEVEMGWKISIGAVAAFVPSLLLAGTSGYFCEITGFQVPPAFDAENENN